MLPTEHSVLYVSAVDLRSTVIVEFQHLCWCVCLYWKKHFITLEIDKGRDNLIMTEHKSAKFAQDEIILKCLWSAQM
jgi:hypothetical protein